MAKKKTSRTAETVWKYAGKTFDLDMNDLGTLDQYDRAVGAMKAAFAECPAGATDARRLIAYCDGIRRMLDVLFGEGTADALLGDSRRPTDYDDVFESLTDFVHEQTAADAEHRTQILNKYKPRQNRGQRRALEQTLEKLAKRE